MKTRYVLLIALVTFVMSVAAMPVYDAGVAMWEEHQLYEEMRTDPAYGVRDDVELQYPFVTVLAVTSNSNSTTVWIWIDNTDVTTGEYYSAVTAAAVAASKRYVSNVYAVMTTRLGALRTVDEFLVYINGTVVYIFDATAIAALTDVACTPCILNTLYKDGHFRPIPLSRSVPCPELLRREPGYVWSWE